MAYMTERINSGAGNRIAEKAQLQDFNERFSNYIKSVRKMRDHLIQTNPTSKINRLEEEVVAARNMYDQEINALREKLDVSSRDRAIVEISSHHNSQMTTEYQERIIKLNTELMKKDEELRNLQLYVAQKEADVLALRTSKTSPLIQLDLARNELEDLHRSIMQCQKKYEEEFAWRVKLQEQVWECKDQLQFEKDLHLKESQDMRERVAHSEMIILQLEEKLRAMSRPDPVLIETVQKIQESSQSEMKRFQEETEHVYNKSLMELQMRLNNDQVLLGQVQEENKQLRLHTDELTTEISTLGKKLLSEEANNGAFIDKLELEHIRSLQQIRSLEARLEEMQDILLTKMKALDSYQDTNISLQNELKFLKDMLEEEEQNMENVQQQQSSSTVTFPAVTASSFIEPSQISSAKSFPEISKVSGSDLDDALPPIILVPPPKSSTSAKSVGTVASTDNKHVGEASLIELTKQTTSLPVIDINTLGQGPDYFNTLFRNVKKESHRPSFVEKKEQTSSVVPECNAATSSATGNMKISEVHPNGDFVRLLNCSIGKEEDIGGYLLQQNAHGYPVSTYRFPPKLRVNADETIIVWAAGADATHSPPSQFVWKELTKFGTGPEFTTILCKSNGQAIAWYTPVRWVQPPQIHEKYNTEMPTSLQPITTNEMEQETWMLQANLCGTQKVQSKTTTPKLETTNKCPVEVTSPVLLKREKGPSGILPPITSPWTQSTSIATHPDYSIPRASAMGNEGSRGCRQSRTQTAMPSRTSGSRKSTIPEVLLGRSNRGPTRSAGPNSRGLMYLGSTAPSGSPLQKYFGNSSFNIRLASQASLAPSIFSNI